MKPGACAGSIVCQTRARLPLVIAAPSFFAKKITLGALQQTSNAFSNVQNSLNFFINSYTILAAYKANTMRLGSFKRAMTKAEALAGAGYGLANGNDTAGAVAARDLTLALPDGREIVRAYAERHGLGFDPAEAVQWATRRGGRSGRVAWQYVVELAGRSGISL